MDALFETSSYKQTRIENLTRKIKYLVIFAAVLSITGLMVAFYEYEIFLVDPTEDVSYEEKFSQDFHRHEETTQGTVCRLYVGVTSVILAIVVWRIYAETLQLKKAKKRVDGMATLASTGQLKYMILEVTFCLLHVPPGFNMIIEVEQHEGSVEYPIGAFICIVMLGRVYFIWQVFGSYSLWTSLESEKVCADCLCEGGIRFAVKAELKQRPYLMVGTAIVISIFLFGIALRTAEQPFMYKSQTDWHDVWNGMWCMIITMTTVGFGDFYPKTHAGRLIGVVGCFWGTFLVSIMVVSLTISAELTPQQLDVYAKVKVHTMKKELKQHAAQAIQSAWKLRKLLRYRRKISRNKKIIALNKFREVMFKFHKFRVDLNVLKSDQPVDILINRLNEKLLLTIGKLKEDSHAYRSIIIRFETAKQNHNKFQGRLAAIDTLNRKLKNAIEDY